MMEENRENRSSAHTEGSKVPPPANPQVDGEEPWTDEDEIARDQYIQETSGDRGRSLESLESEDKE
jgi:hypothetical protein